MPLSVFRIRTQLPGGQLAIEHLGRNAQTVRSTWYGIRTATEISEANPLPPGERVAIVRRYDIRGREVVTSLPTWLSDLDADGEAPHEVVTTYDRLDRVIAVTQPDDTQTTTEYAMTWSGALPFVPDGGLRADQTDADGNTTTIVVDSHGRIVRTVDGLGTETCMTYGGFGRLLRTDVDCQGYEAVRSTRFGYDGTGRLISEQDYVSGERSWDHNGFGDIVWTRDGNGLETTLEVDALGRLASVVAGPAGAPEVDTFTWDTTEIGLLAATSSADGITRAFSYDAYGRLASTTTQKLSGPQDHRQYVVEYEYNAADQMRQMSFPAPVLGASMTFRYGYDVSGYLRTIDRSGPNEELWVGLAGDPDGNFTSERLGSDQTATRVYDAQTRRPVSYTAATPSEVLLGLEYSWTPAGDLQSRTDVAHGQTESFAYDAARRLVQADVAQGPAVTETVVGYNRHGDITGKSDVGGPGTYIYNANGALVRYGFPATSMVYDANGNVTTRGAQTLSYNPSEKLRTMEGGGVALSMRYDAQGQRMVREDAANDVQVVTLDRVYELRTELDGWGTERVTVPTPTGSAVRIERVGYPVVTGGGGGAQVQLPAQTEFIHSTYLGSGSVVVGADGTVAAQVSYDAWGEARDATNWTASVAEETLVELGVGFTGHAAEVDGGLTNMGGRMYDAGMGRFIQRDPVVANAANGASYNRYSYVENKPLRLVDPSGYAPQPDDDTGEGDGTDDIPGGNNGGAGGLDAGGGSDGEYAGLGYITIWVGSAVYHPNGWGMGGLGIAEPPVPDSDCTGLCADIAKSLTTPNRRQTEADRVQIEQVARAIIDGVEGSPGAGSAWLVGQIIASMGVGMIFRGIGTVSTAAKGGGGGQTYQIIDGVRRSKAAEIAAQQGLGNGRIAAQVVKGGRVTGTVEVEAASLLSPKSAISTAGSGLDRWFNTLRQTLGGSKPPPIQVQPGATGTPIKNVLIE